MFDCRDQTCLPWRSQIIKPSSQFYAGQHGTQLLCVFVCSSVDGFGLEAEARMTTWHVMMPAENESDTTHSHDVSEGETDSCV